MTQQIPDDERLRAPRSRRLTVPIYEGGEVYARIRQAKETVGQRRIEVERERDQIRAAVVSAWGSWRPPRRRSSPRRHRSRRPRWRLTGVREEARVGQRTTLDVLNAQQELLNARVNLITAQRDRVVSSYAVVAGDRASDAAQPRPQRSRSRAPRRTTIRSRINGTASERRTAGEGIGFG